MTLYATVDDAIAVSKAGVNSSTVDELFLLRALRMISRRVDRHFASNRPYFAPYIEQREMPVTMTRINSGQNIFRLDWPILAITAAVIGTTTLVIGTNTELWPTVTSPYYYLHNMTGRLWYDYCTNYYRPLTLKITGTWGYHRDWANAFLDVTTLSADIASTTVTSISVTSASGMDAYGRDPWISPGALLQIDSEWLEVSRVTSNTLTVRRGVNGSTAATHDNGRTVSVYQVEDNLRDAVARQAAFMMARRGAYEQVTVSQLTMTQFPSDSLAELEHVLAEFAYE